MARPISLVNPGRADGDDAARSPRGGAFVDDELEVVLVDGTQVWVGSIAARLPGGRVIAFARDITDRRRMVQELRTSEKRRT